jgi:CRP-like cAMP-binding protein
VNLWEAAEEYGTVVRFEAGSVLLRDGDSGRHCYAIRTGEVLVSAMSTQGSTVVLARRGPGSIIGEQSALDGKPRSATVRAVTDVSAVVLTAHELETLLRNHPDVAFAEIKRLSQQMRELTERYALRSEELRIRLLALLETNARETGDPVFRSTRGELADWVGATREATIRVLRELENAGDVRLGRGTVELTSRPPSIPR